MKTTLTFAAIVLLLAGSFSCGKEDVQHHIVGMWIKESTFIDGTADTIVFTNDFRVEKYFKYYEDNYKIDYTLKADSIFISVTNHDDFMVEERFKYSINGNKLTIWGFTYPFSLVQVERDDVIFRKIR
jgi:hypothetical protein